MSFRRDGLPALPVDYDATAPVFPTQARRVIPRFAYVVQRNDAGESVTVEVVKFLIPGDSKAAPVEKVNDRIRSEYRVEYEAWKRNEDVPVSGHPVRDWPSVSERQRALLAAAGILSVEQLAEISDSIVQNLGMDGHLLRDKARAWLLVAKNAGVLDALVAEGSNKDQRISELEAQIKALTEQVASLTSGKPTKGA